MAIPPKAIYRFSAIPNKIPMSFFTELEQIILKRVWKQKRSQIARIILRKKNRAEGITFPNYRLHYKARVIETTWYQHKKQTHTSMEQKREPRNKPHTYSQLIYNKGGKNIQCRKGSLFNK